MNLSNVYGFNLVTEIEVTQDIEGSEDEEIEQLNLSLYVNWMDDLVYFLSDSQISNAQLKVSLLKRDYREEPSPPPESRK